MIFWTAKKELKPVAGGKRATIECQNCKKKAVFCECTVDESVKAYFVVDLWKKTKRVLQCTECFSVCDFYDVFPEEKSREEKERAAQAQKEAEAEARRRAEAAEALKRQEEMAHKKWEEEQKRNQAEVLDELAELKRKMGK